MAFRPFLLVVTVLVALAGYHIAKEPIPTGSSQPLLLKTLFAANRLFMNICGILENLGIGNSLVTTQLIINGVALIPQVPGVTREDATFEGVKVRIYRPDTATKKGMVYFHGGGWCAGNINSHDMVTSFFAKEAKLVVVSVEYRLNPEYSIRDGKDDCVKVSKYFIQNAAKYGVDPERVVVAGDSAGGDYAAAVSIVLRDNDFSPLPRLQLLIYPAVQVIEGQLPSSQQNEHGPFLTADMMDIFKSTVFFKNLHYKPWFASNTHVTRDVRESMAKSRTNVDKIPKEQLYPPYKAPVYVEGDPNVWDQIKEQIMDPHVYPLMADDHKGLPEAYIFTAQYDPIRDEGYLYAERLREDGVKVTHYNCPFGWHGMINLWTILDDSEAVLTRMADFLKDNL